MNETCEGAIQNVAGKVQDAMGGLAGDTKTQFEGKALVPRLEDKMQKLQSLCERAAPMLLTLFVLAGVGVTVSACNTTAGAGQDLSATGHAVTNSAQKIKSGL